MLVSDRRHKLTKNRALRRPWDLAPKKSPCRPRIGRASDSMTHDRSVPSVLHARTQARSLSVRPQLARLTIDTEFTLSGIRFTVTNSRESLPFVLHLDRNFRPQEPCFNISVYHDTVAREVGFHKLRSTGQSIFGTQRVAPRVCPGSSDHVQPLFMCKTNSQRSRE